jgi:hypothetical protein
VRPAPAWTRKYLAFANVIIVVGERNNTAPAGDSSTVKPMPTGIRTLPLMSA